MRSLKLTSIIAMVQSSLDYLLLPFRVKILSQIEHLNGLLPMDVFGERLHSIICLFRASFLNILLPHFLHLNNLPHLDLTVAGSLMAAPAEPLSGPVVMAFEWFVVASCLGPP